MPENFGDRTSSALLEGLSGFWQRFFKDTKDLAAFYEASTQYLGQVYLDLLASVLNLGLVDTPIFNTEVWKLFAITEQDLLYREGSTTINDRYIYDMPGTIVDVNVLQNSIFNPQVLYERNLHYDTKLDGYVQFYDNLFRKYVDNDVSYPERGVAWRTINVAVGNALVSCGDAFQQINTNYRELGVHIGDSVRFISNAQTVIGEKDTGKIIIGPNTVDLTWTNAEEPIFLADTCTPNDLIQVYDYAGIHTPTNDLFLGFYIIKSIGPGDACVRLSSKTTSLPTVTSTVALKFKIFRAVSIVNPIDYMIAQVDEKEGSLVVRVDTPLPYPVTGLTTFRVVRDIADNLEQHESVSMNNDSVSYPVSHQLANENIIPTTLRVMANKITGGLAVEGEDYSIDYEHGIFYQLKAWHAASLGFCAYAYKKTVITVAAGSVQVKDVSVMRQLSLWAPTVTVDRFTLWYNFGSLVNRFETSSEQYKKFLRGIFHLYISGPIFARIESALNLILQYPLVSTDGEQLLSYSTGIDHSGNTAIILDEENHLGVDISEYTFTDNDIGSTILLTTASNAVNRGSFKIIARVLSANVVVLASEYPLYIEAGMHWELSMYAVQILTTNIAEYQLPLIAPIKQTLLNALAAGNKPILSAFDALTDAFIVTDYIEDPTWWHNKEIPSFLWENSYGNRRFASAQLYENIFDAGDEACIDDPGLYFDAGDDGVIVPDVTQPVYRHKVAFTLFDMYLKYHMFMVNIHPQVIIDSTLRDDLDELVLIVKPSYTYPYVEPSREFKDIMQLVDDCNIASVGFEFGVDADAYSDTVHVSNNQLIFDDPKFPWRIDDYFLINPYPALMHILIALTQVPGSKIKLWGVLDSDDMRMLSVEISYRYDSPSVWATGVEPVTVGNPKRLLVEGVDYSIDWLVEIATGVKNPTYGELTVLTQWNLPKPEWLSPPYTLMYARVWVVQMRNELDYYRYFVPYGISTWPAIGTTYSFLLAGLLLSGAPVEIRYPDNTNGVAIPAGLVTAASTGEYLVENVDYTIGRQREISPGVPDPQYGKLVVLTAWTPPVVPSPGYGGIFCLKYYCRDAVRSPGSTDIIFDGLNPYYVRDKALYPASLTYVAELASRRTEMLEYPIQIRVVEES